MWTSKLAVGLCFCCIASLSWSAKAQEKPIVYGETTRVFHNDEDYRSKYNGSYLIKNYFIAERAILYNPNNGRVTSKEIRFTLAGGAGFKTEDIPKRTYEGKGGLFNMSRFYKYTVPSAFYVGIYPKNSKHVRMWDYEPKSTNEEAVIWEGAGWNLGVNAGASKDGPKVDFTGSIGREVRANYTQAGLGTKLYADKAIYWNPTHGGYKRKPKNEGLVWAMDTQFYASSRSSQKKLENQLVNHTTFYCRAGLKNLLKIRRLTNIHNSSFRPKVSALYEKKTSHSKDQKTTFVLESAITIKQYMMERAACAWDLDMPDEHPLRVYHRTTATVSWDTPGLGYR